MNNIHHYIFNAFAEIFSYAHYKRRDKNKSITAILKKVRFKSFLKRCKALNVSYLPPKIVPTGWELPTERLGHQVQVGIVSWMVPAKLHSRS